MFTPKEIAQNYVEIAKTKTSLKWYKNLILAIMAGIFIALAGVLATICGSGSSGTQSILIKAAVFPLGLILVTLAGSELFTGNCLLLAPVLARKVKITCVLKNLGITYVGNVVGSLIIALIAVYGGALKNVSADAVAIGISKSAQSFGENFLLAVPCNVLVCLAVWISMSSKSAGGKILAVYMPIFAFVACGFEHSVANMYYFFSALFAGAKYSITGFSFGRALINNLIPVTLGNVVGGTVFVALPYYLVYLKTDKNKTVNGDAETTSAAVDKTEQ